VGISGRVDVKLHPTLPKPRPLLIVSNDAFKP